MRGGNFQSFAGAFDDVSQKKKLTIRALAWPNGAILTCPACLRRSEKTPEQMEKYLTKWPRCCGLAADVRPK